MTTMRWDAPPSDPIEDIRRAEQRNKELARQIGIEEAFARTRFAAIVSIAREREASGAGKAALSAVSDDAKTGNVWLADEHGLLVGDAGPIVIPRALGVALGATFEKPPAPLPGEMAVVTTGVKLPKESA